METIDITGLSDTELGRLFSEVCDLRDQRRKERLEAAAKEWRKTGIKAAQWAIFNTYNFLKDHNTDGYWTTKLAGVAQFVRIRNVDYETGVANIDLGRGVTSVIFEYLDPIPDSASEDE